MKYVVILTALGLASAAVLVSGDALAHPHGGRLERLKAADTNGDGLLSRAEVQAFPRLAERFDALDANRDGQLAFEELRAARRAHARRAFLARLDADGDGRISKAEALAKAEERFNRADANRDGFITPDELQARRMRGASVGK